MSDKKKVTPQLLKEMFLQQAWPLVNQYIQAALGEEDIKSLNSGCREEVWDLLKALMLQSSNKLDLDTVESPEDVIKAVESGSCTMEEGNLLLDLYKKAKEINMVGVINPGESGGITVNILNANTPEQLPAPGDIIDG